MFSPSSGGRLVMSGDCGGTNTRLVLFMVADDAKLEVGQVPKGKVVFEKKYLNATFIEKGQGFEDVCKTFLKEAGGKAPQACCLACAGGIANNSVEFTNVAKGWKINGNELSSALAIPQVKLINDFEAQGYGLLTLGDHEVTTLNKGVRKPGAPMACVGAGTGLGECFLTCADGKYTCWPSEGGHAEFSPRSELTMDLLEFLKQKFAISQKPKRVSVERVISGPGLANVYAFLRNHWAFVEHVQNGVDREFVAAAEHEQGAVVAKGAAANDLVCKKAVEVFSECYGSEVGVAALKWLPYGGLYVSGGIAAKNPSWVQSSTFLNAYKDKGRLSPIVESVPVYLVNVEDTGERGALYVAVSLLPSL